MTLYGNIQNRMSICYTVRQHMNDVECSYRRAISHMIQDSMAEKEGRRGGGGEA